jgi:hypothetical protein
LKKVIAALAALTLLLSLQPSALAAGDVKVDVTLASAGELVVANKTVSVSDFDWDGSLTVSDALYAAHEAFYKGGAAAGYATPPRGAGAFRSRSSGALKTAAATAITSTTPCA